MKKEEIVTVIDHFNSMHSIESNNMIIGDFNFVDYDIDKGKIWVTETKL